MWQQSTDRRFDVEPSDLSYEPCGEGDLLCRDDGLYESDVFFTIEGIGDGVLPVELSTFSLRLRGDRVLASWRTLSETNNSGFTLQHRRETTQDWSALRFIQGHGTTGTPQEYTFTTRALGYGVHRFRLLQHDYDGTTTTVAHQQIMRHLTDTPIVLTIAPQPVRGYATLTLTTSTRSPTRVDLFDMLGRHVRKLHEGFLAPSVPHSLSLDSTGLSSGQYIIRVESGSAQSTRRVMVVR